MNNIFLFLLFVCIFSNSYAQCADLDEANEFYVCSQTKEYVENDFVVSDYSIYDKRSYSEVGCIGQQSILEYQMIKYGDNAVGRRHNILRISLNDSTNWNKNKTYIENSLPYVDAKENIGELNMIYMKIPIDLDLAITLRLEKERKNGTTGKKKYSTLQATRFMKEEINSSYLHDDINSILRNYELAISDIEIAEPILSTSRKNFIKLYSKYVNSKLPKNIIGIYAVFILAPTQMPVWGPSSRFAP